MTAALIDPYDVALFDLDGVVYLGPVAVPGAPEGIEQLRSRGVRTVFVTNNAARPGESVAAHLTEIGVAATIDDLATSAQAAAGLLQRELPAGATILVAGTQNLVDHMTGAGFRVVESAAERPDAVIQGYDPLMTWPRLDQAALALQVGARWFATNTDSTRPTEFGLVPGAGAAVAAVRTTVDFDPTVVGKPHRPLLEEALRRTQPSRALFVGDRLDTDIAGAVGVGIDSVLVFTGVHGKRDLLAAGFDQRPTAIAWDIPALLGPARAIESTATGSRCGGVTAQATGGRVSLEGDLSTREAQLDALWALAHLVWNGDVTVWEDAAAALDQIP